MSKLACSCGNVMSDVGYPPKHVFHVVSAEDIDAADTGIGTTALFARPEMWVCEKCGALTIELGRYGDVRRFAAAPGAQDTLAWLRSHDPRGNS